MSYFLNENCLFSVIIPSYNCGKYIIESIESVLNQNYVNLEIIVIDDGSTDNTSTLVNTYFKDRVKYFFQENQGLPAARNTAIKKSRGKYIFCLDADDLIPENTFITLEKIIRNHDVLWFATDWFDLVDSKLTIIKSKLLDKDNPMISLLKKDFYFQVRCFKKEFINSFLYDEKQKFFEDIELYIRIIDKNFSYYYIDKPLYIYRKRNDSITKKMTLSHIRKKLNYELRIYIKHYKRLAKKNKEIGKIYSFCMWQLGSRYIRETKNYFKGYYCLLESVMYNLKPIKDFLNKLK